MTHHKNNKIIGVIGGFGPEATAQFYLSLVQAFRNTSMGQQPRVLVHNVPVDPSLEHELLLRGGKLDAFLPLLTHAAVSLERAGADCIVFPCNTLHVHADAIQRVIRIPFISIIRSSVQKLQKHKITRVGLLGTTVTMRQNLFQRMNPRIEFVSVPQPLQRHIDKGIDRIVATQDAVPLQNALHRAFTFFDSRGIQNVLLACTDFHGLSPNMKTIRVFDTVDILVEATVNMI